MKGMMKSKDTAKKNMKKQAMKKGKGKQKAK